MTTVTKEENSKLPAIDLTLSERVGIAFIIGKVIGAVAILRMCFCILDKLAITDKDRLLYSVGPDGFVTWVNPHPAKAHKPAVVPDFETDEVKAKREAAETKFVIEASAEKEQAIAKIAGVVLNVKLTSEELTYLRGLLAKSGEGAPTHYGWMPGMLNRMSVSGSYADEVENM